MTTRLLVLAEGFPAGSSWAGNFHREQFRLLAGAGFDMTVVVPVPWVPGVLSGRNARWDGYANLPARQQQPGFEVLRPRYLALPGENGRFWPDLTRYWAVKGLRLQRPDVILAYFAIPTGAAARQLARDWKVPYAVGMLGDDVNIYPNLNVRNRRLLTTVVQDSAFAFATGPTLAATARAITGGDTEVLSIGASRDRFACAVPQAGARQALGWPREGIVGLYVGGLTRAKGIGDLTAAMAQVSSPVRIVAVGDGPLRDGLTATGKVDCVGPKHPDEVALAMRGADFLVHPSHYEGLPTVLVEAAFSGLPILTTDAPGCIDLGADDRAVVVPVGDIPRLARAIDQMAMRPDIFRRMAEDMHRHVAEHYDLEVNTARLAQVLRKIADRSGKS